VNGLSFKIGVFLEVGLSTDLYFSCHVIYWIADNYTSTQSTLSFCWWRSASIFDLPWFGLVLWYLTPLSTIFQLYRGGQFYWWRKPKGQEKTTDLPQVTDKLYNVVLLAVIGDMHRLHDRPWLCCPRRNDTCHWFMFNANLSSIAAKSWGEFFL